MTASRIAQYQVFLDKDPNNSFARYVIAQEHLKLGALDNAIAEFTEVVRRDPDYVSAYYHGGKTLEKAGRMDEARQLYRTGLEAAARTGNSHAGAELQEALSALG
ncbi:MAG: tetratricopeptide repeat protein [Nitrospirota bacterium]|nr:tetratricopeptide repeat protein [Nitrospirota bacterium]